MPEEISVIDDGTLPVKIRRQDGSQESFTLDVMQAKMAAELVERKHQVDQDDWRATPEFLADLAAAFESVGVTGCTPTVAYQIWHRLAAAWDDIKKNILGTPTSPLGTESIPSDSLAASAAP